MVEPLMDLIATELTGRDFVTVDVQRIYDAAVNSYGGHHIKLGEGLFIPGLAIMGEWSNSEKQIMRDMIAAREQGHSEGHEFGKIMTGRDDPFVATYRSAYERFEKMRPGDLAKVSIAQRDYFLAAIPNVSSPFPSPALVLAVK